MADLSFHDLGAGILGIEVAGEFDLADNDDAVALFERGLAAESGLVVDLTECQFMDSTGLRLLLRADSRARMLGISFAIAGSGPAVKRVLELTALDERLPIFETRDAAMKAVADAPPTRDAASGS